ncbi:MAG: PrgI family protein [Candidatus Promineofilum sp.]|nr:PrgI family protein [Promineifilum sp.]
MSADMRRPAILHADQEHSGLRLVIFLALFAGLVPGFFISRWLLGTFAPPAVLDYATFLSCVGAVPLALLFIYGLEKLLKRVWRSGLSLELNERGIVVHDQREQGPGARGQGPGKRAKPLQVLPWNLEPGTWNLPSAGAATSTNSTGTSASAATRGRGASGARRPSGCAWPPSCTRTACGSTPSLSCRRSGRRTSSTTRGWPSTA